MQQKIYSQQFFFDNLKTESITIKWVSGLKEFYIYFENKLLKKIEGVTPMKEGVVLELPAAGNIFVRLVLNPIGFEVKLGNRYLFNSRIIAEEKLLAISQILLVLGILTIGLNISILFINSISDLFQYLPLLFGVFYIVASIYIKKGYLWFYAFSTVFFTYSTMHAILYWGWDAVVIHYLRIGILALILHHLKYIKIVQKHYKAIKQMQSTSADILDDTFIN